MKLERLDIHGFKTFSNATLSVSSLNPGLVFINGKNLSEPDLESNGSGKSSLLDALFWALFGKTVGGLRNPDVKPWALKDKTLVAARLDGHTVSRSLAPNRTTIDGKDAGPEQIEKLLGMGFELASHTILLGQGRPLFFDLPPAQKMGLLSEALGLERWEERSRRASEWAGTHEAQITDRTRDLHAQTNLEAELSRLMQQAQDQAKAWDAREQVDLTAVEEELVGKRELLEQAQNQYAKHDLAYDGAQTELRALAPKIRELHQAIREATIAADRHKKLQQELQALDQAKTCPTCGQAVTRKNLAAHREELVREMESAPRGSLKALEGQRDALIASEEKFQRKSNLAMDARTAARDQVSTLQAAVSSMKKVLANKQREANPFSEQIVSLKQRRGTILKKLQALELEIQELQKKLELARFWVKGFREVRLFILEELLQEMELTANNLLEEVGLVGWEIVYDIEKETKAGTTTRGINVWIKSPTNDQPVRWESWSGGEGQRLKIIGAATLSDVLLSHVGAACNVECWDESSSFMSDGGVEDFVEFLANRAEDQQKVIFMVDHVARESARFASTITITKGTNGVSTLT